MKNLILFIFVLLINQVKGQFLKQQYIDSPIYKLKLRLEKGDKKAFFELTPYFDSHNKLSEFLGSHYLETEEQYLAKRVVRENSIFANNEIIIDSISTSKQYLDFLNKNSKKIQYSSEIQTFYITAPEKRESVLKFRELPQEKIEKISKNFSKIIQQQWIKNNQIDFLLEQQDSKVLLKICEEFYRQRYKFNSNQMNNENSFFDLLKILIKKDIGVKGWRKGITWEQGDFIYDNNAILDVLIYFSKNYRNFKYSTTENYFINNNVPVEKIDNINSLFENLYSENDSIASKSFIQLTQSNPLKVGELSDEKESSFGKRTNSITPIFPFRFLKQLSLLTEYCRQNKIDFIGTDNLSSVIKKLSSKLSFQERRQIENSLINELTFEDLTSLEYWTFVYEKEPELSKSASRILDIYYSKNWSKILNNDDYLKLYLKKSLLYRNLGINGNHNYYLIKFTDNGSTVLEVLDKLETVDSEIILQIQKAKKLCLEKFEYPTNNKKINDANYNSTILNISDEINKIRLTAKDDDDFERQTLNILAKVGYSQIPNAVKAVDKIKFREIHYRNKYSFLESDYGFFFIENWNSLEERNNFLNIYNSHNEKQLYQYFLDKAEIDYKNTDGNINYDKIFEILKFNTYNSFSGGSESKNEVSSIIKILELEQKTRLGFADKLCNSAGIYGCSPMDRTWEWMKYLENHKLLKQKHANIVSFNYGYYLEKVVPYLNNKEL